MSLLSIQNLSISIGEKSLVRGASLAINAGEMLALVGESGSGKSLTALSVMRLLSSQFEVSGEVHFDGKALHGLSEAEMRSLRGRDIGMIFQEPMTALNPLHTIGKQIEEAISVHQSCGLVEAKSEDGSTGSHGLAKDPVQPALLSHRISTLLTDVGLAHLNTRLSAYPHELSGGERQRVMIAMAIANNPKLLIADEPTTAVDVTIQATILQLLKKLQRERGMAMLFITHDLTLVRHMSERVAIMKAGEVVEQGTVADVWAAPKHPYTKALLKSTPQGEAVPLSAHATTLLSAENLGVAFPIKAGVLRRVKGYKHAAQDVSLALKTGETLGLVGESGSGKTTLAMALIRQQSATGTIVFAGQNISSLNRKQLHPLRKEMQLVFQDPFGSLNPRMTVGQIIGEGLRVHGVPSSCEAHSDCAGSRGLKDPVQPALLSHRISAATSEILTEVGLTPDMASRYPHEFSGGQRQRISIARALVLKPKLVVLDEPTSALDLTVQSQILTLLKDFQTKHGIAYLMISHDLRAIRAIAHRIVVLKNGHVVEAADTKTLFTNPQTPYTKGLIQAAWL
jgi:microcin C transport system ATP-binding protein